MIKADLKFQLYLDQLRTRLEAGSIKTLFKVGDTMRRTMKNSIKSRKGTKKQRETNTLKGSPKGTPPYSRKPKQVLKNSMWYEVNKTRFNVVVGPRGSETDGFARVHEFGGTSKVKNNRRRKRRHSRVGEIETGRKLGPNTKRVTDYKGRKVKVTYGKLFSPKQVRNANKINKELYGPDSYLAKFPKRPFAKPVLDKFLPALPKQFANIL